MKMAIWGLVSVLVLALPVATAAAGGSTEGYAALVRQVAPSVVTVMVEEKRVSAGQRAAELATSASPNDVGVVIRRLLAGNLGSPMMTGLRARWVPDS